MSTNNLQNMLLAIHDFAKPIVDKIEQIQKELETQIFLKIYSLLD